MDKPVFGEKEQSAEYLNRYAAYIIVEKNNEIALIEAPNGAFFLPGGEIEGQETKKEALRRELIEEMGIAAEIDIYLGEADEYSVSYTHLRAHETDSYLVCRLLLEKKKNSYPVFSLKKKKTLKKKKKLVSNEAAKQ